MIINTGGRTDLAHYYPQWLLQRFKEGFVYVRNPLYPEKITKYLLSPETVDCVIFCSKNYAPLLDRITEITDKFNTYFFYTITAYGKDIEKGIPDIDKSIDTLIKLEKIVGKERISWRYDPVLLTKKYTVQQHLITFEHMTARLHSHVRNCIFSFVQIYKKIESNFPELEEISPENKDILARGFGKIAAKYRMQIKTCAEKNDYTSYGIQKSGCVTLNEIADSNDLKFKELKHSGMRKNCRCIQSNDIGAYDTCPGGCRYCYANSDHELAEKNYRTHDFKSPILTGKISTSEQITNAKQKSFLVNPPPQLLLFE
ncbi:DUF1848 domain-containing protein [Treponema rectale]|uniref:DUF1848 domain-containing protein n=1 Tax=Treponema rectale TaxID=744512 RepID=A0A840SG76_9SPIR|nr:DUF1848 domain-containing protein [Treponema rectale]MBB5218543.1 hypothetical protein [Treponema rectale]QOS39774.1 DUF1848 domain-containing protein [Treponema rectale]